VSILLLLQQIFIFIVEAVEVSAFVVPTNKKIN